LFGIVAVIAGGLVGADVVTAEPPPIPVVSRPVSAGADRQVTVRIVGNTALRPPVPGQAAKQGPGYDKAFAALQPWLANADFVLAVAEAPITDSSAPGAPQASLVRTSAPQAAEALSRAGVDALLLSAGPSSDAAPDALTATREHADAAGVVTIGAGPDLARAEQPLLMSTEFGTVAVVGFSEFGHRAGTDSPGTTPLTQEAVKRGFGLARAAGADWVIATPHWGEGDGPIQPRQRYWAQMFADTGYSLVIGSGPAVAQPIEFVDEMPVVYSVGNFVQWGPGRETGYGTPVYGLSVDLQLRPDRAPSIGVRCLITYRRPVERAASPCNPVQAQAFLLTVNPELDLKGDLGAVPYVFFPHPAPS
jgi:poly-gamma-glutamate synthesis protein (capsule biosynthesis protein)